MERFGYYDSPFGLIKIATEDDRVTAVRRCDAIEDAPSPTALSDLAYAQLEGYFSGARRGFDLPLAPKGTEFQRAVWNAILGIPYGETRSYRDIAVSIGNPKAVRAVGMACNRNPIWILIPCHRVVGSDRKLTGYAGGLTMKKKLLDLEHT